MSRSDRVCWTILALVWVYLVSIGGYVVWSHLWGPL